MAGATTDADLLRIELEHILAPLSEAQSVLRAVVTRMAQQARTEDDASNIRSIIAARKAVECAQRAASRMHANGRTNVQR